MKIKTVEGTITTNTKLMYILLGALERASEYERQKGHLYDHQSFQEIATDIQRGLENGE